MFNAQGSRFIIVVLQVRGISSENICKQYWRCSGKIKEGMKLSLPPKLVEKLVWVRVISFRKISFTIPHLTPYYAETGRSRPPNRLTLPITLIC